AVSPGGGPGQLIAGESGRVNLNNDVVYRRLRLGPLHQLCPGRSRLLIRHHNGLHRCCPWHRLDASLMALGIMVREHSQMALRVKGLSEGRPQIDSLKRPRASDQRTGAVRTQLGDLTTAPEWKTKEACWRAAGLRVGSPGTAMISASLPG